MSDGPRRWSTKATPVGPGDDPTIVAVYHFPSDDDVCHVALTFGVGWRDETVPTQGVLHAIEHLAMYAARHTAIEVNASVDSMQTQFVASGRPELVAAFLNRVVQSIRDPPVERLAAEARVLAVEEESEGESSAPLHRARYGFRDLGVRDAFPPAPQEIRESVVIEWAHRWFIAGNAFLLVDGPYPARADLTLRPGVAPRRNWPAPRSWPAAHAILVDGPACAVSFLLPPPDESRLDAVALAIITNRVMESLRHDAGHTYAVGHEVTPISGGRRDVLVHTEPGADRSVDAIRLLIGTMNDLCTVGPDQQELALAVERTVEGTRGREAMISETVDAARDLLYGVETPRPDPDRLGALTVADLTSYLQALSTDMLYLASEEARDALAELGVPVASDGQRASDPLPAGTIFRPSLLARALNSEARQATLVLTEQGLLLDVEGDRQRADWDDVVGVAQIEDDELVVFSASGSAIPVGPRFYRRGGRLIHAVTGNVPANLIYQVNANNRSSDRSAPTDQRPGF